MEHEFATVEYAVDNPWARTKRRNMKPGLAREHEAYPLTYVKIETLPLDVVTVCGEPDGIAIMASIRLWNDRTYQSHATWAPERDKEGKDTVPYSFAVGAKLALTRAMNKADLSKELRASIWTGFFAKIAVK